MSLHINSIIEKVRPRKKPKAVNTKKAIPVFTYPCEGAVYTKNDVITVNRNVLAGTKEGAYYEMDVHLKKQGATDYTISVTMPQGHHIDLIAKDAGLSICNSFLPFKKAEEEKAARQKRLDLAAASRATKVDLALDGLNEKDMVQKLQRAHNKGKYIN